MIYVVLWVRYTSFIPKYFIDIYLPSYFYILYVSVLHPRVQNYIEEVVDRYTDGEFRQNFRMNRRTFNHILNLIRENISTDILDRGRHTISSKAQLLIALWYFGTPDSYR